MTDDHCLKVGMLVTWGSGEYLARVILIMNTWLSQGVRIDSHVRLALIEDTVSQCGQVFPAGTEFDLPLEEVRLIN